MWLVKGILFLRLTDRNDGSQDIAAEIENLLKTYGNERHADDEHIEHVEGRAEEGTLVKDQAVRHQLEEQFQCEDRREEHVELAEQLYNKVQY